MTSPKNSSAEPGIRFQELRGKIARMVLQSFSLAAVVVALLVVASSSQAVAQACKPGQANCSGRPGDCISVTNDVNHCGSCSTRCKAGQSCVSGACVHQIGGGSCKPGTANCSGRAGDCTSTTNDLHNCGSCGTTCRSGQSCVNGACVNQSGSCKPGTANCSGRPGACISVTSDPNNCGRCGAKCRSGQVCVSGACRAKGALLFDNAVREAPAAFVLGTSDWRPRF